MTAKVWEKGEKGVHGEQDERPDLGHTAEVTSTVVVNMRHRARERGERKEMRGESDEKLRISSEI